MYYNKLTPFLNKKHYQLKVISDILKERNEELKMRNWIKSLDDYHLMLLSDYLKYKERMAPYEM